MVEAQVQWSADGRWWWDGAQWQPAQQPAARYEPEYRTVTYDKPGRTASGKRRMTGDGWRVMKEDFLPRSATAVTYIRDRWV